MSDLVALAEPRSAPALPPLRVGGARFYTQTDVAPLLAELEELREEVVALRLKVRVEQAEHDIDKLRRAFGLTPKEARVLLVLRSRAPNAMKLASVFSQVWSDDSDVELKIVDVMICKLRKKLRLRDPALPHIDTIWGTGRALNAAGIALVDGVLK